MEENNSKPKIRFKGFSDDWEERQLCEIVEIYDGTHQTPNYTDSGIMFLSVENVKTLKSEKFISKEDFEKEFKIFPQKGDILMTRIGDIGTANIVNTDSPLAYYVSLALLKNTGLDSYFLKESIHSNSVKKELWHRTLHIAFPKKINKNEIAKVLINYPVLINEQKQIGTFFEKINNLITLQERKCEKLENVKKAMLEKIFPQNEANIPKLRFKDYTDDWKECELGEVLTERKILQKISKDAPILAFAAGQGVIDRSERKSNNRDHLTLDPTNKTYLLTEYNDIVYNPSNLKYGAIDRNKHGRGVISPIYVTFTTDEEPSFVELIVKSEKFKTKALLYEEGTVVKRQSVKPANLLVLSIKISTIKEEQYKIGMLFEYINNLINLQKQKYDKLKNIKKAMLEKMFV